MWALTRSFTPMHQVVFTFQSYFTISLVTFPPSHLTVTDSASVNQLR